VARAVRDGLEPRGFRLVHALSLAAAVQRLTESPFDAVILDLTLPDGNGLDLAGSLRQQNNDIPILMLTAKDRVTERVEGFRHGADDYLCKPFETEELVARLWAILRRARAQQRHILRYADIELDLIARTVRRGSIKEVLSIREADLLGYLLRHPEEVLPRDRILQNVWGDEAEEDSNVLNVYINYLRNKLEGATHSRVIHTVRRAGYVLSLTEPEQV